MADGIWLSVGDHGSSTDELNLLDRDKHRVLLSGGRGFRPTERGTIELDILTRGLSPDQMVLNARNIIEKLVQADRAYREKRYDEFVSLGVQLGTTYPVFFDIYGGTLTPVGWNVPGTSMQWLLTLVVHNHNGIPIARGTPEVRAASVTLTNGSAKVFVDNVPGDLPADVKLSITDQSINSQVIQRFHISRRAGAMAAGDWAPVVDVTALTGASNTVDATAFGGSYAIRTMSSTSFLDIARAVMPAGALNQGKFDVWARIFDAAAPVATPSTFVGTPDNAPIGGATPTAGAPRQTAAGSSATASVSASWPAATLDDSLLLMAVKARSEPVSSPSFRTATDNSDTGTGADLTPTMNWSTGTLPGSLLVMAFKFDGTPGQWEPPSGWNIAQQFTNFGTPACTLVVLYIDNAASHTGAEALGTLAAVIPWSCILQEFTNAGQVAPVVLHTAGASGEASDSAAQSSIIDQTPALVFSAVATAEAQAASLAASSQGAHGGGGGSSMSIIRNDSAEEIASAYAVLTTPTTDFEHGFTLRDTTDWVMVSVVFTGIDPEPDPIVMTPPAGYGLAAFVENFDDIQEPVVTALFYQQDAPSESGAKTVTFDRAVASACRLLEYTGVALETALVDAQTALSQKLNLGIGPTAIDDHEGTLAVAIFGAYSTTTTFGAYSSGYTERGDANGLAVADDVGLLSSWSISALASATGASANILAVFRDQTDQSETDLPGQLEPGTYQARIQAVTTAGYAGTPSATISDTVDVDNSAIDYSWVAPSALAISHYRLTIQFGSLFYVVNTPDATTSFRLETLAGLATTSGFPTVGETPYQRIRARVGTTGSGTSSAILRDWIEVPSEVSNAWHLVYLGTFDLPPQPAMRDGSRADWAIEIQGRSAGGAAASLRVDALFLFSATEPGLFMEYDPLTLATPSEWLYEIGKDGTSTARLQVGGVEAGQIINIGRLTLMPGGDILSFVADVGAGVNDLVNAQFVVQLTIYPYYLYQRGA